jgi:uncharacterized protein
VASWEPTERVTVPSAQQGWEALTFVHFAYAPEVIARLLPPGLEPDVHDGRAWVGITPFLLHAALVPVAPGPRGRYVELNVRTYVRDRGGRDGLWFLTLELNQPLVAAGLRTLLGVPYRWSDTSLTRDGAAVGYRARRHRPHRAGRLELRVEVGAPLAAPPGELETFLVGRWRAFTQRFGAVVDVPVEHEPWPLHRARLTRWRSERFLESLGLPAPRGEPHVLYSPGVETRLGLPRPSSVRRPR